MATVGSGDVLAGLIAGFRAQGIPTEMSAWAGVYVHGRAGDIARDGFGERSMLASDILESIPLSLRELE
jgi:NAD(P)H-hydrate epimerase